jgi:hypothetical protein
MPRRERSVAPRSIIASARNYTFKRNGKAKDADGNVRGGEEWQRACWDFFDVLGEYRQGPNIMGALLSRATLLVEEKVDGKWVPSENPTAQAALDELYGGDEGHPEMLRLLGMHFTVAGEAYLISPEETAFGYLDDWQVAAATEVTRTGGVWKVNGKPLEGRRMVVQLWRPHPRNKKKADSPSRAIIPVLNQILQLRKRTAAQIDSRLTGAGLMILPAETEFQAMPTRVLNTGDPVTTTDSVVTGAQGMADMLMDVAEIAIQDQASAEARIPVLATVPGEFMEKIPKKPIDFWSELDAQGPELLRELIIAAARGMDIPSDILLGNSGSNHWNAWLSDENNVKIHGEPTLKTVTTGLTTGYLWIAIAGEPGIDDPRRFRIAADTTQMRLRPNRSKEALELNDRLILSDRTALLENGFTEADMMTEDELRKALLRKMAQGSSTPELVAIANRLLGVEIPEIEDNRELAEARPTPSLEQHPVRELPQRRTPDAAAVDSLIFACEVHVNTALQRAGNRIKSRFSIQAPPSNANRLYLHVPVTSGDLDDLLKDAWGALDEISYDIPAEQLARALDIYTRGIIMTHRTPDRASLKRALQTLLADRAA